MGKSSAASAAAAACDHMRDWFIGTGDRWVSMGVIASEYGVDENLCFSYPVTCENGEWKIISSLTLNEFQKSKIVVTEKELKEER